MGAKLLKLTSAAMSLTMLFCTSGCGMRKVEKYNAEKHFTVYIKDLGTSPSSDNKIFKKIKDELGYTFDFDYLVGNEADKLGVMIAGHDYDDILSSGETTLIQAGALIPLDNYITEEKTPNLYRHLEPIWDKCCYEDGHLYIIPNYNRYYGENTETLYHGPAFWIQKAVLAEFGYPEVETLDEYFELIEKYRDKHPEIGGMSTIGFEILTATGYEYCMMTPPSYLAGNPNDGDVIVDKNTYEAKIYADSQYAERYFRALNRLYDKGLLDAESFTQSREQYLAKISSGRVLGMFDQHWQFEGAENVIESEGDIERTYVPLPLTFEKDIEPWYRTRAEILINQGYGISVNCKHPEEAVKMIDTFLSEKWQKIFQWGIEGEDYMVNDEGRFYLTDEQRNDRLDPVWDSENRPGPFFNYMPKIEGQFSDGNATNPTVQIEEFEDSLNEYDKNFLKQYGKRCWVDFLNPDRENPVYYPAWNIDLINGSDADYAHSKLTDLAVRYLPELVMSDGEFDAVWNEYCGEIGKINIEAYEKRVNDVIQWRLENWTE